jgi:hypothetical protein
MMNWMVVAFCVQSSTTVLYHTKQPQDAVLHSVPGTTIYIIMRYRPTNVMHADKRFFSVYVEVCCELCCVLVVCMYGTMMYHLQQG